MINKILLIVTITIFIGRIFAVTRVDALNTPPLVNSADNMYQALPSKSRQATTLDKNIASEAVNQSLKWQTAKAQSPILSADGVVRFAYGQYQPVITCKPLNLCDIELEAGEEIQGILIGDSVRWNEGDNGIPVVYSGEATKLVPHLVLKPSQAGLDTTLMVTTSRRTYMIKLRSASLDYVERAGFYYPHQEIINYQLTAGQIRDKTPLSRPNSIIDDLQTSGRRLNYGYTVENQSYDWRPSQVFDDGISVFIKMPTKVFARDLPSICVISVNDSSECEMINFRYVNGYYIIDKLFRQAKLINGFGRNAETLLITSNDANNKVTRRRFWSRVFSGE